MLRVALLVSKGKGQAGVYEAFLLKLCSCPHSFVRVLNMVSRRGGVPLEVDVEATTKSAFFRSFLRPPKKEYKVPEDPETSQQSARSDRDKEGAGKAVETVEETPTSWYLFIATSSFSLTELLLSNE